MKTFRGGGVVNLAGIGMCAAFNNFDSLSIRDVPPPSMRKKSMSNSSPLTALVDLPCFSSRRGTSLCMDSSYHEASQSPQGDCEESVDISRRAAIRQFSSIFAATAFATTTKVNAAEFSSSLDEVAEQRELLTPPPTQKSEQPQFSDPNIVITPLRPSSPASVAQVTLENSQVVTIPTKQIAVANQSYPPGSNGKSKETGKKPTFMADVVVSLTVLGGAALAVSGRVRPNYDELSSLAKVVMIQNEPYGLDKGRRFYNGVNIRINDPVPASDVRKYCDAGEVNDDCTDTITGFLGEVSNTKNGMEPTMEQQETATAVLSYLDSLSAPASAASRNGGGNSNDATSDTSVAFSSYLNAISCGNIHAPTSPQLVAKYLSSLAAGAKRLSTVESRVNDLESSVHQLPDDISGRLEQWQEAQDERLKNEFMKIEEYLMTGKEKEESSFVNGEYEETEVPELVKKFE